MTSVRSRFGLSRSRRLTEPRAFNLLRESGTRAACGCLVANWRTLGAGEVSRLGVIASRRVGPAVARNRAKRLLREAFRLHQHDFAKPLEVVLIARNSIVGRDRSVVERDFLRVMRNAGVLRAS
jgi:ribonuclease P protein component